MARLLPELAPCMGSIVDAHPDNQINISLNNTDITNCYAILRKTILFAQLILLIPRASKQFLIACGQQ